MTFTSKIYIDKKAPVRVIMVYDCPVGFPTLIMPTQFEHEILIPPCTTWTTRLVNTFNNTDPDGFAYQLHLVHCTVKHTNAWGYTPPQNDLEYALMRNTFCDQLATMAVFMAERVVNPDPHYSKVNEVPFMTTATHLERLMEHTESSTFNIMSLVPDVMCRFGPSPTWLIRADKAPQEPSKDWVDNSEVLLSRPPIMVPWPRLVGLATPESQTLNEIAKLQAGNIAQIGFRHWNIPFEMVMSTPVKMPSTAEMKTFIETLMPQAEASVFVQALGAQVDNTPLPTAAADSVDALLHTITNYLLSSDVFLPTGGGRPKSKRTRRNRPVR